MDPKPKPYTDAGPGDYVLRLLGGEVPHVLRVDAVTADLILCGADEVDGDGWTFDRATGAEVDHDLGWGPQYGVTGSYLVDRIPD